MSRLAQRTKPSDGAPRWGGREIGPLGTMARVWGGVALLGSVTYGHMAGEFRPAPWALGPGRVPRPAPGVAVVEIPPHPGALGGDRSALPAAQLRRPGRAVPDPALRSLDRGDERRRAAVLRRLYAAGGEARVRGVRSAGGVELAAPPRRPHRLSVVRPPSTTWSGTPGEIACGRRTPL